MTLTKFWNILYYLACAIVALSAEFLSDGTISTLIPTKWAHVITAIVTVATWFKSHRNLFTNPDGTPAAIAFVDPRKQANP